eukprot:12938370-Prorocentrum_lima.AAC.1
MTARVIIASSEHGEAIWREKKPAILHAHVVGGENIVTARRAVNNLGKDEDDLEEVELGVVQPQPRLRGEQL